MTDRFMTGIPQRTAQLVDLRRRRRLFETDDRTLPASGVLLLVFAIVGMGIGFLGESDQQVAVFTMTGAAIGMTLSFCWHTLIR